MFRLTKALYTMTTKVFLTRPAILFRVISKKRYVNIYNSGLLKIFEYNCRYQKEKWRQYRIQRQTTRDDVYDRFVLATSVSGRCPQKARRRLRTTEIGAGLQGSVLIPYAGLQIGSKQNDIWYLFMTYRREKTSARNAFIEVRLGGI